MQDKHAHTWLYNLIVTYHVRYTNRFSFIDLSPTGRRRALLWQYFFFFFLLRRYSDCTVLYKRMRKEAVTVTRSVAKLSAVALQTIYNAVIPHSFPFCSEQHFPVHKGAHSLDVDIFFL